MSETHFSCETVVRELWLAILSLLLYPKTDGNIRIGKQGYVFLLYRFYFIIIYYFYLFYLFIYLFIYYFYYYYLYLLLFYYFILFYFDVSFLTSISVSTVVLTLEKIQLF